MHNTWIQKNYGYLKLTFLDYIANQKNRFQNGPIIDIKDIRDLNLIK